MSMSLPLDFEETQLRKPFSYRLTSWYGIGGITLPIIIYLAFLASDSGTTSWIPHIEGLPDSDAFILPTIILSFILPTISAIACIYATAQSFEGVTIRKLTQTGLLTFLMSCAVGSAAFVVTLGFVGFGVMMIFSFLYLGYALYALVVSWLTAQFVYTRVVRRKRYETS